MPATTVVFDAYGTLFDTAAAVKRLASEPGRGALAEAAPRLAALWRDKQLAYTWLRAVAGDHADFRRVTEDALDWALEAVGLPDDALRADLMALYDRLDAFPEAEGALRRLKADGRATAILSNGTPAMLDAAVGSAGLGAHLDAVLSVEAVGVFKPHARVYDLVGHRFGTAPGDVLFVSANGWDAAAGAAYGFRAAWVNRAGAPVERLPGRPRHVVPDLLSVPEIAA